MSSPWSKVSNEPVQTASLADIMSEQYAHQLHDKELKQQQKQQQKEKKQTHKESEDPSPAFPSYSDVAGTSQNTQIQASNDADEWEDYSMLLSGKERSDKISPEVLKLLEDEAESDAVIAQMLQSQFDHEYNEELRRIERQQNKQSKITVTLNKFLRDGDAEFLHDTEADDDYEEDELERHKRDWDRFETNEKILDAIPKCGFKVDKEGEMITKHDPQLCGVRNAQRVMSFPPENFFSVRHCHILNSEFYFDFFCGAFAARFVRPLPAFPRIALVFYYGRFYGEIANQSNNIFFVFVQQKYINFSLLLLFLAKNVQVQQKVSTTSILLRISLSTNILLSIK